MQGNRIKVLKIKNFMSLRDVEIEFDESNIISLCGYNDSGKSAVTRLMEVMFYNAYPSDQVKFITDGEEFWEGLLVFEDGVEVRRVKYADGKSEFEMKKDGKIIFTNRLDNGSFAAMGDIPEKIKEYLGVIQDEFTDEKLNVRRNTDKLFLITTTGGENYKILNSVLQSDMLAETSQRINKDKNKANTELNKIATKKELLTEQLEDTQVITEEKEKETRDQLNGVIEITSQFETIGRVLRTQRELDSIVIYPETEQIDTKQYEVLRSIINAYKITERELQPEIKTVDTERIKILKAIISLQEQIGLKMYDEVNQVEIDRYNKIKEVGRRYNNYFSESNKLEGIINELEEVKGELGQLSQEYGLKICDNCGSIVA